MERRAPARERVAGAVARYNSWLLLGFKETERGAIDLGTRLHCRSADVAPTHRIVGTGTARRNPRRRVRPRTLADAGSFGWHRDEAEENVVSVDRIPR